MSGKPVRPAEARTRSGDEARSLMQAAYGRRFTAQDVPRGGAYVIRHFDAAHFAYREMVLPAPLAFAKEPRDDLVVVRLAAGRARRVHGRQQGTFAAGDVFLGHVPGRPCSGSSVDLHASAITLPEALLARAAALADPRGGRPLRFTRLTPVDRRHAAHWERVHAYARSVCDLGTEAVPLIVGPLTELLAGAVLQVFPNTAVGHEPALADSRDATHSTAVRATAYIDDQAHSDIGLADIADAAQVTPRALQYAFRRHLGTTPMTYLRRVRLAHAHTALKAADPVTGATVTRIAAQWGFLHTSRFSAAYRAAYGRSPRDTLHG
ncbi:helix-turn-helix transcriptional regulator [Streptomyces sp. NPDC046716]|uniref:helix-turn-helix transcriptional regulator n=1 Tax=Streptomyces sp. NPDC046716 TaxID=3157093 RepID=UPI0033C28FDB